MNAYFVTGTDTEVGKTTVSRALLAAALARNLRTRCFKPAESGCQRAEDGSLQPLDALGLWEAGGRSQDLQSVCPYRFHEALAPGVAAVREGVTISFERLEQHLAAIRAQEPDLLLVEGAGGLLVPMGGGRMIVDVASLFGFPMLIVARPSLGTINHTLLTIECARGRGLEVAGIVFSASDGVPDPEAVASNASEIAGASGVEVLGCLPYLPGASLNELSRAAEGALNLKRLLALA